LAALRIDLVGTTADFRRFSPRHPAPINHSICENRGMQGRIGEVRLVRSALRSARPHEETGAG
jgi:hypothetical protein